MKQDENDWQTAADELRNDTLLQAAVVDEHRRIYSRYFLHDPAANHVLPVMTHAFRRLEQWRVFLLLTPWMLSRLFIPDGAPGWRIPPDWQAHNRRDRDYQVIGPTFELPLLTGKQRAHLNYSPAIGHYLLHPLILSMLNFSCAEEAFTAWNRVIETRNRNIEKLQKRNPLQQEITRREFFRGIFNE
ncbi:MAG: [NiFe]-hydrogenase assembly chaperone HybE [Gammaproteobacteria bacterium]|nr:[NiFe]-hydrogenase assembly chaperone HybE [Gammaproteobacteria bacterium]